MRAAGRELPPAAGEPRSDPRGEQPRQKCVYVEPPRRVKEILAEHLHFQEEECSVKHPAAEALEGVWNVKNNVHIRLLKPVSQNRSDSLLQPQFYSRHTKMKICGMWLFWSTPVLYTQIAERAVQNLTLL